MKRPCFLFNIFLFVFILFGCNKNKIILNPDYENRTLGYSSFGIDRIELTDTATIFEISLYNQPGYWVAIPASTKLIGRSTGKEYHLKWMEGLAPDIMMHVDSTGFYSTKLFFEPLDVSDTKIDLIEEGAPVIKGIKLYDDSKDKIKTTLTGSLNALGASWILCFPQEPVNEKEVYIIPVRDGKFRYDFFTDQPLIFYVFIGKEYIEGGIEGGPSFWSEGGEIKLDFNGDSSNDFTISGGPLTQEIIDFKARQELFDDSLYYAIPDLRDYRLLKKNKKFYTPVYYSLKEKIKKETVGWKRVQLYNQLYNLNGSDMLLSEEGKKAILKYQEYMDLHYKSINKLRRNYFIREYSDPTLTGLYKIFDEVKDNDSNIDFYLDFFNKFYPDTFTYHPYYTYIKEISDLVAPVKGNHFINVTLPDKTGEKKSLMELLEGKSALIDIHSEDCFSSNEYIDSLIPVYEKFHDKGFEIVSIILDNDSIEGKKETDYAWTVLIDPNDKSGAWTKYRLGEENSKSILVNKDGLIETVNPTVKDVKNYLNTNLK